MDHIQVKRLSGNTDPGGFYTADIDFVMPKNYYFLVNGSLSIDYLNNGNPQDVNRTETMTSSYSDGWNNYIDNWTYSDTELVKIKIYSGTELICIKAAATNTFSDLVSLDIQLGKVNNSTISKNINGKIKLIVFGNKDNITCTIDSDPIVFPEYTGTSGSEIKAHIKNLNIYTSKQLNVSSNSKCTAFIIKEM